MWKSSNKSCIDATFVFDSMQHTQYIRVGGKRREEMGGGKDERYPNDQEGTHYEVWQIYLPSQNEFVNM